MNIKFLDDGLVNGMVERLLFRETYDGIEVELIEIDSTHYGNKK